MQSGLTFIAVMFILAASALSTTRRVPTSYATIQAGIDAAVAGDTVLVGPGVWTGTGNRDLLLSTDGITLLSSAGAANTIIDCQGTVSNQHRAVNCEGNLTNFTIIDGFTFRNGRMNASGGGAINLEEYAVPTIRNCIFSNCYSGYGGGAVRVASDPGTAQVQLVGCLFQDNSSARGGAIRTNYLGALFLANCTFLRNRADSAGGAIRIDAPGRVDIRNCTFYGNQAPVGASIDQAAFSNQVRMDRSLVTYSVGGFPVNVRYASLTIQCSNIFGNSSGDWVGTIAIQLGQAGNISLDPQYCNAAANNYALQGTSPCLPANNSCGVQIGAYGEGCPRAPRILNVPSEFAMIQLAINYAVNSDTVLIADGHYFERLAINGKNLVLASHYLIDGNAAHAAATVIDADSAVLGPSAMPSALRLLGTESCLLVGLTLRNGIGIPTPLTGGIQGSEIYCTSGSVTLRRCTTTRTYAQRTALSSMYLGSGTVGTVSDSTLIRGGLNCYWAGLSVTNSTIQGVAEWYASQDVAVVGSHIDSMRSGFDTYVNCTNSTFLFANSHEGGFRFTACSIADRVTSTYGTNTLYFVSSDVGRIDTWSAAGATPIDVTSSLVRQGIRVGASGAGNPARSYLKGSTILGETWVGNYSQLEIDSCILSGSGPGCGVRVGNSALLDMSCSDLFGFDTLISCASCSIDTANVLVANPSFCSPETGDYTLYDVSPCLPANNSCGVRMGLLGQGCQGPIVQTLAVPPDEQHVLAAQPQITWSFIDGLNRAQTQFEIAVGTDNDWTSSEQWNPAPFDSPHTFVIYDGPTLLDGQTYFIRLRVFNGTVWSPWFYSSFRMNSLPSLPALVSPTGDQMVGSAPFLTIAGGTDAENDVVTFDYEVYEDPGLLQVIWGGFDMPKSSGGDTTVLQVGTLLDENAPHWWRVRSYDQYEYSPWTSVESFWVNAIQEPPSGLELVAPRDTLGYLLFSVLPEFSWQAAVDPDPHDTVRYKFEISNRPNFTFAYVRDSLLAPVFSMADSLDWGTRYYWRVTATDKTGLSATSLTADFWTLLPGDIDLSHEVDITDLQMMTDFLFFGGQLPPLGMGDLTGDCSIDLADLQRLVDFLFFSGPRAALGC